MGPEERAHGEQNRKGGLPEAEDQLRCGAHGGVNIVADLASGDDAPVRAPATSCCGGRH